MRYDKEVYFVKEGKKVFDQSTGDYITSEPKKTKKYAALSSLLSLKLTIEYGKIKGEKFVLSLQNHYNEPFNYIEIDGVKYNVEHSRKLRVKHNFIISERQ